MDKAEYTMCLEELTKALRKMPEETGEYIRVVVTGLMMEPIGLLDAFTEAGYVIVEDDLAHESRQVRTLSRKNGSAMEKIIYRILDLRGDTFFYEENKSRGRRLIEAVRTKHTDGVVSCLYKFCDPEEFDYPVYRKELADTGIPMLSIEVDQQAESSRQIGTRLQSFSEMIHTTL